MVELTKTGEIVVDGKSMLKHSAEESGAVAERKLLKRAKRGDAKAFETLISNSSGRMFALIGRMVDDRNAVEDVAQNAYIKAWLGLKEFRGQSSFSTWLYRIAVNEALTHIRRETRRRGMETGDSEALQFVTSGKSDESRVVDKLTVRDALSKLPQAYRTAINLSYMDELSYEEAAKVMEVPLNTYRTYVHRGKIKLRRIIEGVEA